MASPADGPAPSGEALPVVDRVGTKPELVRAWPLDSSLGAVYDGRYLVTSSSMDEGRTVTVSRAEDESVALQHSPRKGFRVESVHLDDPWLVIVEVDDDDRDRGLAVAVHNVENGKVVDLADQAGLPPVSEPEMALQDGLLYYATGNSMHGGKCHVRLALPDMSFERSYCAPEGLMLSDPGASADGLVLGRLRSEGGERCKRLVVVPDHAGPRTMSGAVHRCDQWSGYLVGDTVVWDEGDPADPDFALTSQGYAMAPSSRRPVHLGPVTIDTLMPCAGAVYWTVQGAAEIRRWRPGDSAVDVVYRAQDPVNTLLSSAECQRDGLLVFTQAVQGIDEQQTLALRLDSGL